MKGQPAKALAPGCAARLSVAANIIALLSSVRLGLDFNAPAPCPQLYPSALDPVWLEGADAADDDAEADELLLSCVSSAMASICRQTEHI